MLKTIPWHTLTHLLDKYVVATYLQLSLTYVNFFAINHTIFLHAPYKLPPSITFFCLFLSFSLHTLSWAFGSLREPWKIFKSLFVHSFVCPITYTMDFSQIYISTSPMYALVTYIPVILFSAQPVKHLNVFVKGYYTAG